MYSLPMLTLSLLQIASQKADARFNPPDSQKRRIDSKSAACFIPAKGSMSSLTMPLWGPSML